MRTKFVLLALITAAVSLVAASFATANPPNRTTFKLKAATRHSARRRRGSKSAKQGAAGRFTATLKRRQRQVDVTFKNLSGAATAAHVRAAPGA